MKRARSSPPSCRRRGVVAAAVRARGATRPPRRRPGASVLLVTIDTLRADRVGAYGAASGADPAHRLARARRARSSRRRWPPCPLTLPSHATILSGLEPPAPRRARQRHLRLSARTGPRWPRVLNARGLRDRRPSSAAYVLDRRFGLARGFDAYDDAIERRRARARACSSRSGAADAVVRRGARTGSAQQTGPVPGLGPSLRSARAVRSAPSVPRAARPAALRRGGRATPMPAWGG